jgi:hypothetical protein
MTFDTALNLVWALAGTAALGALEARDIRRQVHPWDRCRRALVVFIACVALFPCVSASDDMVQFERLKANSRTGGEVVDGLPSKRGEKRAIYLARLLESLENFQISTTCQLRLSLCLLALVGTFSDRGIERPLPSRLGRSPPEFVFLSQVASATP